MGTETSSEYGEPRQNSGDARRYPNGQPRRLSQSERLQNLRSAGMKDQPLPDYTRPGLKIKD